MKVFAPSWLLGVALVTASVLTASADVSREQSEVDTIPARSEATSRWRVGGDLLGGSTLAGGGALTDDRLSYTKADGRLLAFGVHLAREPIRLGLLAMLEFADLELSDRFLDETYFGYGYCLWLGWEFYGLGIWDHLTAMPLAGIQIAAISLSVGDETRKTAILESEYAVGYVVGLSVGAFGRPDIEAADQTFMGLSVTYLYRFAQFDEFSVADPAEPVTAPFRDPGAATIDVSGHLIFIAGSIGSYFSWFDG